MAFQSETKNIPCRLIGGFVFLVSLIVYWMTVQRTLSLWDCGEFIACSYTLSVAHPPGTPLFLLIGRIFSLLPIVADISYRVNLLSVFTGAAAATVGYFVSVRLLSFIPGVVENSGRRLAAYLCSATGALLLAFGRTNWSNAVEAEVYAASMMLTLLLVWLALRWFEQRGSPAGMKYLILISYLAVLSVGIHMTVFLAVPPILLFIMIAEEKLRKDIRFWISSLLLLSVSFTVTWFLGGLLIWTLIAAIFYLSGRSKQWLLALMIAGSGLVGYSSHAYIWIRAAQEPNINQNNPQTRDRFVYYIERKQYGQESMLSKMFKRRASWANQLGDFPRIGFGGFLLKQYGFKGLAFLLPAVLALIGIVSLVKFKWRIGFFFLTLVLIMTIGLVLYMNFSDGSAVDPMTGYDKLEVRDRDYFFTPGFILIALCIGLGAFFVIDRIVSMTASNLTHSITIGLSALTLLIPLKALFANYAVNNRSNNFLAYDYAYNFLMSCPQDAIMFTNGDNDTFPVWCLQEVYGIRRDVRVANLSLIQTDWYQLQLKHQMGVPITLEDDQMLWKKFPDGRGGILYRPAKPFVDHARRGMTHPLIAFQDSETGKLVTVADQMVEHIIVANRWKYPLIFANGFPDNAAYPLAQHSKKVGLVVNLVPEAAGGAFDEETTWNLYQNIYKWEGLRNPLVFRDDVATTLMVGAAQTMMEFVDFLDAKGDDARAAQLLDSIIEKIPEFWQSYARKVAIGNMTPAQRDSLFERYFAHLDSLIRRNPENTFYRQFKGISLQYLGRGEEAIKACEEAYHLNPAIPTTYRTLVSLYISNNRRDDAVRISREYLKTNPGDQTAQSLIPRGF